MSSEEIHLDQSHDAEEPHAHRRLPQIAARDDAAQMSEVGYEHEWRPL
jgi:hypothetical protein